MEGNELVDPLSILERCGRPGMALYARKRVDGD